MACYDLLKILAEVPIKGNGGVSLLGFAKDLRNGSSAAMLGAQNGRRAAVLLNDILDALLHFGEHGVKMFSRGSSCPSPNPSHAVCLSVG
jgi:hypothetical protein